MPSSVKLGVRPISLTKREYSSALSPWAIASASSTLGSSALNVSSLMQPKYPPRPITLGGGDLNSPRPHQGVRKNARLSTGYAGEGGDRRLPGEGEGALRQPSSGASRHLLRKREKRFSPPPEQPLDVGKLELDIGRAAVVALAGAGRRLHGAQQRVHLLGPQGTARAHRMMAGEGRKALIEPAGEALGAVLGGKIGGEVADEPGEIALSDDRRRLADENRAGAETFDHKAERSQFLGLRLDERRRVRIEVDHERGQQRLPLDPLPLALALELFIDDPLVRRMLVDDDEPIRGLGDDVVPMHLRPRGAERRGEVALGRFGGR